MQNFSLTSTKVLDNVDYVRQNSEEGYVKAIQSLIQSKPFGKHKFYIYTILKRVDDRSGVKKFFHQPRLTKPNPLPGTTLLRADPSNPEEVKIIWTLPNREDFHKYSVGKLFADEFVCECVAKYCRNRSDFLGPEEGDLTEYEIREVYKEKHKKS